MRVLIFAIAAVGLVFLAVACGDDDDGETEPELAVWAAEFCRAFERQDALGALDVSTGTNIDLIIVIIDDLDSVRPPSEAAEFHRDFVNMIRVFIEEAEKRMLGVPVGEIVEASEASEARLSEAETRYENSPLTEDAEQALRSAGCGR